MCDELCCLQGSQAWTCYPSSYGFALVASRMQNRLLQSATVWSLALLLLTFLTLNCTCHHALSAPLLIIVYFVFQTYAINFKDSTLFLSLSLHQEPSFLCVTCSKLCLPWSHSSRFTFSLLLTLPSVSCLPQINGCLCMRMHACMLVCVCVGTMMTNLCMLILRVLMSVVLEYGG